MHRQSKQFQFHKGTIRTFGMLYEDMYLTAFQFHKGTIRTCRPFPSHR